MGTRTSTAEQGQQDPRWRQVARTLQLFRGRPEDRELYPSDGMASPTNGTRTGEVPVPVPVPPPEPTRRSGCASLGRIGPKQ